MRVAKRGKIATPGPYDLNLKRGGKDAFLAAGIRDDHPVRIDHDTPARIGKLRLFADAINADNVSLILDRASLQEREPMLLPLGRPERDDDKEIRPAARGGPKDFREPQIVADKRRDGEGRVSRSS